MLTRPITQTIKASLFALLLLVSPAAAHGNFHATPLPYSCEQVKWATSHFSAEQLRQFGKDFNIHLSPAQIAQARKCEVTQ